MAYQQKPWWMGGAGETGCNWSSTTLSTCWNCCNSSKPILASINSWLRGKITTGGDTWDSWEAELAASSTWWGASSTWGGAVSTWRGDLALARPSFLSFFETRFKSNERLWRKYNLRNSSVQVSHSLQKEVELHTFPRHASHNVCVS